MTKIRVGAIEVDLVPDDDRVVIHHGRDKGGFEPQTRDAWAEIVRPGSIAIDVGAYTGLYAIAAAKLGVRSAWAFEPVPINFERLQQNCRDNGVWSVQIVKGAASDESATVPIYRGGSARLTSGATLTKRANNSEFGFVNTYPIDLFKLSDVSAIKIDAERAELAVLRGARETIERNRPAIIVEDLDSEESAMLDLLPRYRVARILDKNNLLLLPQ